MDFVKTLVSKTNILFKLILDIRIFLRTLCLNLSVFIILIRRPQLIVMLLIFQAFIVTILLRLVRRVWYAYVLFLVFLGGMLVIFIYIRRLASWVKVDRQYENFLKLVGIVLVFRTVMGLNYFNKVWLRRDGFLLYKESVVNLLISGFTVILYFFIIRYLLLVLFIICGIVKLLEGPLRKFSFEGS